MKSDKKKLYENLFKVIKEFILGKRYEPLGQLALFKRLSIAKEHIPICKKIVKDLLEEKVITIEKRKITVNKESADRVTGLLRTHPRGFGFVIPDHLDRASQDIFVPKHLMMGAVDGDHVEVKINPYSNWDKGPDGEVVKILERGRTHLAGTITGIDKKGALLGFAPLLGVSKPVFLSPYKEKSLKVGDRVIIRVKDWGDEVKPTRGEITYIIGHINDPSCDIPAAIEEFDLCDAFSSEAILEAKSFGKKVLSKDKKGRKDLTKEICVTIDPETARDYDDAISITQDRKGHFNLGVHIADVAHYVSTDSLLDKEAIERCNSVYFPGKCLPMLPEELSNELCSLKEKEMRLTVSVLMRFDSSGSLIQTSIVRSVIKSRKRFTYEEAKEVLDGKRKSPHQTLLKRMAELALLLKKKRKERGSFDFSLPETVVLLDDNGSPHGVKKVEYDLTHQMIEEFMLKANEMVATHLIEKGKQVLFRIHEPPSPENLEDFFSLARSLGFSLPPKPTPQELQKLFQDAQTTPFAAHLSIGFIRSMKLAYYSTENIGHYGLSLENYCHFTSPIRRYSDLVIQRLLFDEEGDIDLEKIALLTSAQERVSFKAENTVLTLKKMRLLKKWNEEKRGRIFTARINRIKPFGLFFELDEISFEGFLHISELGNEYFHFDAFVPKIVGSMTNTSFRIGDTLKVMIVSLDLITLESKWRLLTRATKRR